MDVLLKTSQILKPYSKDKFLLAVSGGADSMALTVAFIHLRKNFSYNFSVVYVHHGPGQYKEDRDRAKKFIQEFCLTHKIEFYCPEHKGKELKSEKDLRDFRYQQLRTLRLQLNAQWIVLAHHAQDLLETRFIRLIRGTGLQGLQSMSLENSFLLRPFLTLSVKDLRELLKLKKIDWYEDSSNQNLDPFRNWLRNEWLPQLEERREGALCSLARSLELMQKVQPTDFSCIQDDFIMISDFFILSIEEKKQALAFYMKSRGLKNYGQSHINEILKRLDSERKDFTFQMLRREWRVNAGRLKVLGLG